MTTKRNPKTRHYSCYIRDTQYGSYSPGSYSTTASSAQEARHKCAEAHGISPYSIKRGVGVDPDGYEVQIIATWIPTGKPQHQGHTMPTKRNPTKRRRHTRVKGDPITAAQHRAAIGEVKRALKYCGISATVRGVGKDRGILLKVGGFPVYLYPFMKPLKHRSLRGDFDGEPDIHWFSSLGDEWGTELDKEVPPTPDVGSAAVWLACYTIAAYVVPYAQDMGGWHRLRSTRRN